MSSKYGLAERRLVGAEDAHPSSDSRVIAEVRFGTCLDASTPRNSPTHRLPLLLIPWPILDAHADSTTLHAPRRAGMRSYRGRCQMGALPGVEQPKYKDGSTTHHPLTSSRPKAATSHLRHPVTATPSPPHNSPPPHLFTPPTHGPIPAPHQRHPPRHRHPIDRLISKFGSRDHQRRRPRPQVPGPRARRAISSHLSHHTAQCADVAEDSAAVLGAGSAAVAAVGTAAAASAAVQAAALVPEAEATDAPAARPVGATRAQALGPTDRGPATRARPAAHPPATVGGPRATPHRARRLPCARRPSCARAAGSSGLCGPAPSSWSGGR